MTTIESPARVRTSLADRLVITGEAILDIAALLPPDTRVIYIGAMGAGYRSLDLELQVDTLDDGLAAIRAFGGIWQHTLHQDDPSKVRHYWHGTVHGAVVRISARWVPPAGELDG